MTAILQKWKAKHQYEVVTAFKLHQSLGSVSVTNPKKNPQDILIRCENIKTTYLPELHTQEPSKALSNFYHVIQYKIARTSINRLYLIWSLQALYLHAVFKIHINITLGQNQ